MSNRSSIYASELLKRQRELEDIRVELRICGRSELARFQQRETHLVALIARLKADVAELSA